MPLVVRAVLTLCGQLCGSRTFGQQQRKIGIEIFIGSRDGAWRDGRVECCWQVTIDLELHLKVS